MSTKPMRSRVKPADIDSLVRPHLANIKTYEAVEPLDVLAAKAGIPADQIIKLNGNENPYGWSPKVAEAVAKVPFHVYSDPLQHTMRRALGSYTGMDPDRIIVGAGSDELIDVLFRLFVSPGEKILNCEPTFDMYGFFARVAGTEVTSVPRDDAFDVDIGAIEKAIDSSVKIVFISSPNNPTGNVASEVAVRALLHKGLIVAVDEAYYEFCGETVAGLLTEYENLVVLRTMSKWAGLAGLRVGYGLMSPTLAQYIIDIKSPYTVSVAAEAALLASLEDAEMLLGRVELIVAERERMFSLLGEMPGVKPWPSGGNFILCEFEPGRALDVYEGLGRHGIFVRKHPSDRLREHLRITVGTPEQTDAVVGAMAGLV